LQDIASAAYVPGHREHWWLKLTSWFGNVLSFSQRSF